MKICDRSFENMGMTVTNQNLINEEIKSRLNMGYGCYHFRTVCLLASYLKM
jgi:hypothetical protein